MLAPMTDQDAEAYEVVFGSQDNSKYEILKGGQMVKSVVTYNILSDEQFRSFWVEWKHGNLTAGRGQTWEYPVITHHDLNAHKMVAASFSTWNTCPGNWDIDQRIGKPFRFL